MNEGNIMAVDLAVAGWVVALLMLALQFWNSRRKPPIEAEFATKKEVRELEQKIDALRDQVRLEADARSNSLFDRLNEISEALGDKIDENYKELQKQIVDLLKGERK